VALKLGGEGSYLIDTTSSITARIPAFKVDVIDTTGAGDSYDGGFIAGRLSVNGHLRIPLFGHEKSPRERQRVYEQEPCVSSCLMYASRS